MKKYDYVIEYVGTYDLLIRKLEVKWMIRRKKENTTKENNVNKSKINVENKREREKEMVSRMIKLYCRRKHHCKTGLCEECAKLNEYARFRSDKCPFMESKTFCSNCKVHCYKPEMREKIRSVMRFSGPRMIFHHPVTAIRHVIESRKEKKKINKHKL